MTANAAIEELYLCGNPLTSIAFGDAAPKRIGTPENVCDYVDLAGALESVTSLEISGSRIAKVDVSNNKLEKLTIVGKTLNVLHCQNNLLTALDLSNCTNLEQLFCYSNRIVSLDVSMTKLNNGKFTPPLDCVPMATLQTLTIKAGWTIGQANPEYVPSSTKIETK